jgi:hypothetical protein
MVWVAATPPMLATMGIRMARATTCSSVASKSPITRAAIKAATRLQLSHRTRRRMLLKTGANMSTSSSRPAMESTECSASSRITSTTSSMVMRPRRKLLSSTTGAETRSWFSKILATSDAGVSASMASMESSVTSRTLSDGSEVSSVASGSQPR